MEKNESEEKVQWNLASAIISEIGTLLNSASTSFILCNFKQTFLNLKAIKMRISPHLSTEEREKLSKIEVDFLIAESSSNKLNKGFSKDKKTDFYKHSGNSYVLVEKYNNLILDCLKKYGYLIPPKEDETRLKA